MRCVGRRIPKTIFQIGAHRQVGRRDDISRMGHHKLASDRVVAPADRKRVTRACGREGLKPEMRQDSRGSYVPWIWNDEGARPFVQLTKRRAFFCLGTHLCASILYAK